MSICIPKEEFYEMMDNTILEVEAIPCKKCKFPPVFNVSKDERNDTYTSSLKCPSCNASIQVSHTEKDFKEIILSWNTVQSMKERKSVSVAKAK